MHKIKFSHRYLKMKDGFERSTLLDVLPVDLKNLSIRFLEYDTVYEDAAGNQDHYRLPRRGAYMILILQNHTIGYNGHVWTTIRRRTPEKEAYYRGLIGQEVECVVSEAGEVKGI